MPQYFDPNEPLDPNAQMKLLSQAALAQPRDDQFNFESKQQAIEARKRALTDAMRRKAGSANAVANLPEGRVVGDRFVGPHWSEMLAAALQPAMAQWDVSNQEKALQKQTDEYSRADEAAAAAHQARMPTSRRVPTSQELPGPTEEGGPLYGQQTVKPTAEERMKWAQEGQRIPSRKELLSRYIDDLMIKEPEREEARAFRKEESDANRAQTLLIESEKLRQKEAEALLRSEDKRLSDAQRAEASQRADAIRLQIAGMNHEIRKAQVADQVDRAANKPPPQAVSKSLDDLYDRATTIRSLSDSFNPEYSGPTMGARTNVGQYIGTDSNAVDWWKNYRKQSELTERHAMFGSALTEQEQKAWHASDIDPKMKSDVIQRNLATRAALAEKIYNRHRERSINLGYGSVKNAYEPITAPNSSGATGSWDSAPKPGDKVDGYTFKGGNPADPKNWSK
jgi:hypothetical protein